MGTPSKTDTKLIATIVILGVIYLAMLIGLSTDDARDYFTPFIPVLYLLTFITLLSFHKGWNINFLLFIVITIFGGFLIQLVNAKTGLVFGKLKYGTILGPKVLDVPVFIIFNRFVLLYCVGILVSRLKINHAILSSFIGAFIIVLIDLIAEPVATSPKFRAWTENMSPIHNYGIRFITSVLFLYLFNLMNLTKKNRMSLPILLLEISFLIVLNLAVI